MAAQGAGGEARGLTRRGFLAGAAAASAAASGWFPTARIPAASAATTAGCVPPPPGFPAGIPLYVQAYENWSGELAIDGLWTCAPASADDVVTVAAWAAGRDHTIRPRGYMHGWSPLTVSADQTCASPVVLVDTTQSLRGLAMEPGGPAAVRVGAGESMEALLTFLEAHGYGLNSVPAVGDITVGGALAIDGHGAAVPAVGEVAPAGAGYGSLSNLVLSLTAVAWDGPTRGYRLRTFTRGERDTAALLTHLGRTFVTEVVLQVTPLQHLRCRSYTDVTNDVLFAAPPAAGPRSFAAFLDEAGRAEVIVFPFTDRPWLKVWSVSPRQPLRSRRTSGPYNYPFSDSLPPELNALADEIIAGNGPATELFGPAMYTATVAALSATASRDLWGPAKDTQLYIRATTLRVAEGGGAVVVARRDVQRAVHEFMAEFDRRIAEYRALGRYPVNGPVEIRASGLDRASEVLATGAEAPLLSALGTRADHPDCDTVLWVNMLTFPGTPWSYEFFAEMDAWAAANFAGRGFVRPEWSKGWAYSAAGPFTDDDALRTTIPSSYPAWRRAVATLDRLDPARVFTNPFLDRFVRR